VAPRATSASLNKNATIKLPTVYLPKITRGPYNKPDIETAPGLRINKVETIDSKEQMVHTIDDDSGNLNLDYLLHEEKPQTGGATIFKQEKVDETEMTESQFISETYSWQDQTSASFNDSAGIPGLKIELIEKSEDGHDFGIPISDDDDDEPLAKYRRKSGRDKKGMAKIKKVASRISNVSASVTIKKVMKGGNKGKHKSSDSKKRAAPPPPKSYTLPSSSDSSSDSDQEYEASYKQRQTEQQERMEAAQKLLDEHYRKLDVDVDTYECKQCPKRYTTKPFMLKHLKEDHKVELNIQFPTNRQTTVNHIDRDRRYNCQYCDRSYIGMTSLTKHTALHGPNGELRHKCSCCTKFFATEAEQEAHQIAEHLPKLECSFCSKRFKDPEAQAAHIRFKHSEEKKKNKAVFMCNMCGKNFNSRTAVSDHERSNCGQDPLYGCDVCGKHYHSAGSLKTHRGLHEDSLPFICKYCGKR
jgi:hypothetical protein